MSRQAQSLGDGTRYVTRGGEQFEQRRAEETADPRGFIYVAEPPVRRLGLFSCCSSSAANESAYTGVNGVAVKSDDAPDADFYADALVKLSNGVTAYRLIEPSTVTDAVSDSIPLIVCLHDISNCSYMWAELVDLLVDCDEGPGARVLVLDFYGRGRSPWTGVPLSLDVLVVQVKELLDFLNLAKRPSLFIGQGMGGVVATGFAAKYPSLVASLTLIAPMGVAFKDIEGENYLKTKFVGEMYLSYKKKKLAEHQEAHFYNSSDEAEHRHLIDKQIAMVKWQIENTPGYLGAYLSTVRIFPIRQADELFTAVGRHPRSVLIVWGDHDEICDYSDSIGRLEGCFEQTGTICDIRDSGHDALAENFRETALEVLAFARETVMLMRQAENETKAPS